MKVDPYNQTLPAKITFLLLKKTLLSKQPRKTWFLAFVPLGRNSTILPKLVWKTPQELYFTEI